MEVPCQASQMRQIQTLKKTMDLFMADDEDIEDDYGQQDPPTSSDESEEPPRRMADPFDMDEFLKDL